MLNRQQKRFFRQHGYLMLHDAVTAAQLQALQQDFTTWCEHSRNRTAPYGKTLDGRPRFDLEPRRGQHPPALRRVASPTDISPACLDTMRHSSAVTAVAELIGPDIRFHHSKINSKLPGTATRVQFHQDFLYTPHSNDDVITVLYFLDDVTDDNGPLEVIPGSHTGPLHSLWHRGVFTGAVADETAHQAAQQKITCTGAAGSACLMHTRLLHGSAENHATRPRTLFICVYSAQDAMPLSPNPLPSRYAGEVVCGQHSNRVRCANFNLQLPEVPTDASFFAQQARHAN